jgi:formate hydrogenlyase subunit 4
MSWRAWLPPLCALVFAPLFAGVVNRTKALIAGRRGPPLLQLYFDVAKLWRKGAVYSGTTTWVFRAAPVVTLAGAVLLALIVPLGGVAAPICFTGDFVLVIAVLAAMRFALVLAALDTGSAFEGMGASREVQFATFVEPTLLLGLAALGRATSGTGAAALARLPPFSLAALAQDAGPEAWLAHGPALALLCGALVLVHLAENCRIPFDDPETHLELTMIHEVQILDHGGPDLGGLLYGSAVKLWLLAALVVGLIVPVRTGDVGLDVLVALAAMAAMAIVTGLVESSMARLRLLRVPQLLVGATALSALAAILTLSGGGS